MRYIRTEDGRICKVPNKTGIILYDNDKLLIDTTKKGQTCIYGIVEKQADNIEELCDEFVIKVNVHNIVLHDLDSALSYVKDYKNHELTKDYIIYGAIWTDEGLIYKAKMKGILPNGEIDWELL